MDQPPPPSTPRALPPPDDRLDSWKEIAAYLRRDVTTVQRWEKREGMPVHRHVHDKSSSVYAFRTDLDTWARRRNLRLGGDELLDEPQTVSPGHARGGGAVQSSSNRAVASPTTRPASHRSTFGWALAAAAVLGVTAWLLQRADYFWTSPIAGVPFELVTDFGGTEQAAAVSPDGRLVAFLSDRDGPTDLWMTQLGTGQFYNLTHGSVQELVNPSIRAVGFSPDGALVTFWTRKPGTGEIGVWAVPALGGQPKPYLEGAAEFDWSTDGLRLVYHTPAPGDPMFVREPGQPPQNRPIFHAPPGLHAHFPLWSPNGSFIYFVQGSVPDAMDIWRIRPMGGVAERITRHNSRVSHPVMLDRRTLLYLATGSDGAGPWLHSLDVERRVVHRLTSGVDRYTSLAVSADRRRLVATLASPKETLWRLPISDTPAEASAASRISLTTGRGSSPRLGPGYLLYVSSIGTGDAIWKLADGKATELWRAPGARVIGGPAVAADGRVAFSIEQNGRTQLHVMNADGTNARVVTESLDLRGSPAWAPDGRSITSAAADDGIPRLFTVPLDGRSAFRLLREYSVDPVWSPDGRFIVYSGPDVGTTFRIKAVGADARPYPLPSVILTRGARSLRFLTGRDALVVLRGEIQYKNLWLIDLATGTERQLTNLPPDFQVRDFDISPDGREVVLDRVQEHSNVVLLDLGKR
jgi:Tol biopolymer transport system component